MEIMMTALSVMGAVALVSLAFLAWRHRKWRLAGRDRYTRLGRIKQIPIKRDPHQW